MEDRVTLWIVLVSIVTERDTVDKEMSVVDLSVEVKVRVRLGIVLVLITVEVSTKVEYIL